MKMMMSQHLSINVVLVCLITLVFANVSTVKYVLDTTIDDFFCSDDKVDPYSDYAAEIAYALEMLTYQTCSQPLKQLSISGKYVMGSAYGQTNVTDINDCVRCLEAASGFLKGEGCYMSVNAYVVLIDCEMRYFSNPPLA